MFYGGFGSMSYSTSEEPSSIQLEASKYIVLSVIVYVLTKNIFFSAACRRTLGVLRPRMKDIHSILLRNPKVNVHVPYVWLCYGLVCCCRCYHKDPVLEISIHHWGTLGCKPFT